MPSPKTRAALTEEHAAFVCGPHSVIASSCDAEGLPSMARCLGCEVSADRCSVTLIFHARQAAALLRDIAATGRIAVVYNEPATHVTLQLKGRDARPIPTPEGAEALAGDHIDAFMGAVAPLGFSAELVRAVFLGTVTPVAAVQFTPEAAYQQTPGPKAGARLT